MERGANETTAVDQATRLALLQSQLTERQTLLEEREVQLRERETRIRFLEEVVRVLRADRFGPKREKLYDAPGQGALFNEVEVTAEIAELAAVEPELQATPMREAKPAATHKPGRRPLAAHLPQIEVRHELPASGAVAAARPSSRSTPRPPSS